LCAQRRYVIDYYYNPNPKAVAAETATPADPLEPRFTRAIHVDVRPAVDDVTSALDRLRRFPSRLNESLFRSWFRAEGGLDPKNAPKEAAALSALHSSATLSDSAPAAAASPPKLSEADTAEELVWTKVDTKCGPLLERLRASADEDERGSLHVALNLCVASVVCPDAASKFQRILEEAEAASASSAALPPAEDREEAAFLDMNACVVRAAGVRRQRQAAARADAAAPTARLQ
jgi:hypothetical protein